MICFSLWFWLWCAFYNRPLKKYIILLSKCTSRLADKRILFKLVSIEFKLTTNESIQGSAKIWLKVRLKYSTFLLFNSWLQAESGLTLTFVGLADSDSDSDPLDLDSDSDSGPMDSDSDSELWSNGLGLTPDGLGLWPDGLGLGLGLWPCGLGLTAGLMSPDSLQHWASVTHSLRLFQKSWDFYTIESVGIMILTACWFLPFSLIHF